MHKLYLYNTKTKKKEEFVPINSNNVTMYVCGPTLYDAPHIGNARPLIVFDCLYKLLQLLYAKVSYARNITDIDDKIIKKANQLQISTQEVVAQNLVIYKRILKALNIGAPTYEPLATNYISNMAAMIEKLLEKGYAYIAEDNVIFNTKNFIRYGELSHKNPTELVMEEDQITKGLKYNETDFVLWKPAKSNEPFWEVTLYYKNQKITLKGRPGWHIECSAMIKATLGETIDIHGGGNDLIFPHHENERAQSLAANDKTELANYWLHNGFITLHSQKMSKSLGNFITIDKALETIEKNKKSPSIAAGNILRLTILTTHYRHPLNFKEELLTQAENILEKLHIVLEKTKDIIIDDKVDHNQEFLSALLDDLNTPLAITALQHNITELNKISANIKDKSKAITVKSQIVKAALLLGIITPTEINKYQLVNQEEGLNKELILAINEISTRQPEFISALLNLIHFLVNVASDNTKDEEYININNIGEVFFKYNLNQNIVNQEMLKVDKRSKQKLLNLGVNMLIAIRNFYKQQKNYKDADNIREALQDRGILLEDTKNNTTWRLK